MSNSIGEQPAPLAATSAATPNATGRHKAKVLIVDDHPMVRERIGQLINHEPDLTVCGEADDGDTAMDAIARTAPDLALIDIGLKNAYGIELVKELKLKYPDMKTLVLSMHDESLYAERALRAGARGYITKQEASQKVVAAIRRVLGGGIYVSERMAGILLGRVAGEPHGDGSPADRLTDREMEIFQLLGEGLAVREIAKRLRISVKTIEAHRSHIKEKLNIRTSPELLRYAIQTSLNDK